MLADPAVLLPDAPRLRAALQAAGWSTAALDDLLGAGAREHLDRGETAPLLRRTEGGDPLHVLARLLVVGASVPERLATDAGVPLSWLVPAGGGEVRCPVRLQPVRQGGVDVVVPHDPGRSGELVEREQVLGVGAASLTLAAATPRDEVRRVLDLGCGSGVQALLAEDHADAVVATDTNPRAVGYARLAAALAGAEIDVRQGSLLEPVAGEAFDLVVSNPPFVVGPASRYTYRDAGMAGDDVCRRLLLGLPDVLVPGGHAVLLASWLHLEGEDGDERVLEWLRETGCDGWVVQREVAAPEDYVTAWLRDTDEGERFDDLYAPWTEWFAAERVEAVAFGVVALRRPVSGTGTVRLDDVPQQTAATWGEEVVDHFRRVDALGGDLLDLRLRLRDDVRLVQVGAADPDGWAAVSQRLQQETGLRWSGGIDDHGAALVAGCDGTVPFGQLVQVLATALDEPVGEVCDQVVPVAEALVRKGFLLPVPG
ncbi:MAG: class I SAM-dependent methyltransferase [Mycobacteriales bacterium]|nr:class I SAM-dependent methyltransferase [Mycobacteriales bacterium]